MQNYYATISGACKRLSTEEKEVCLLFIVIIINESPRAGQVLPAPDEFRNDEMSNMLGYLRLGPSNSDTHSPTTSASSEFTEGTWEIIQMFYEYNFISLSVS